MSAVALYFFCFAPARNTSINESMTFCEGGCSSPSYVDTNAIEPSVCIVPPTGKNSTCSESSFFTTGRSAFIKSSHSSFGILVMESWFFGRRAGDPLSRVGPRASAATALVDAANTKTNIHLSEHVIPLRQDSCRLLRCRNPRGEDATTQ